MISRSLVLAVALFTSLASCGGGGGGCQDPDADGFGPGCERGPDCDETNPTRNVDCVTVPAPDCDATPLLPGCPCLPSSTTACFDGLDEQIGVGICVAGRSICIGNTWGICAGAVPPRGEVCDSVDQDCDGFVDEGVLSPCGGCTPGCRGGVWGSGSALFEPGPGAALTDRGWLTLAFEEESHDVVWVANSAEGTLSRIDASTAIETARYLTGGSEPSRVAVDYNGDVWVANREFGGRSTLRKVAGFPERCVDADGSGTVETSGGPSDVLPEGGDECVLLTVPVGDVGGVARALAVDGNRGLDGVSGGDVWVGLHDGEELIHLDGVTGAELERVATPAFAPYAASFDAWGTLWLISRDGFLARVDRRERPLEVTVTPVPAPCFLLYGLAVDREGRVVATGFSCDQAMRFDPLTDVWSFVATPASVRGAVVQGDHAWVAHTGGRVSQLSLDPFALVDTFELDGMSVEPFESIGIGADSLGNVWVASGQAADEVDGVATRVSAADGEVTAQVVVGRSPHTQGDLTGQKLLGGFVDAGVSEHVFTGCVPAAETQWQRIHLGVELGAAGSVEVAARHAADEAGLSSATYEVLGALPDDDDPFEVDFPDGGVVEVRLTLSTSARDGAPRVSRVGLEWRCPGPE